MYIAAAPVGIPDSVKNFPEVWVVFWLKLGSATSACPVPPNTIVIGFPAADSKVRVVPFNVASTPVTLVSMSVSKAWRISANVSIEGSPVSTATVLGLPFIVIIYVSVLSNKPSAGPPGSNVTSVIWDISL